MNLTQADELARFLALAVMQLGGHLSVSKQLLDNMRPVRLVWDATSEPDRITLAVISNEVIELVVEKPTEVVPSKDQ